MYKYWDAELGGGTRAQSEPVRIQYESTEGAQGLLVGCGTTSTDVLVQYPVPSWGVMCSM